MENGFNFYNSENDGYRGGFGDYTDPTPETPEPASGGKKPGKGFPKKIVALVLACAIVGGGAGVGVRPCTRT